MSSCLMKHWIQKKEESIKTYPTQDRHILMWKMRKEGKMTYLPRCKAEPNATKPLLPFPWKKVSAKAHIKPKHFALSSYFRPPNTNSLNKNERRFEELLSNFSITHFVDSWWWCINRSYKQFNILTGCWWIFRSTYYVWCLVFVIEKVF